MVCIQHIYVYSFLVSVIAGQVFLFMQGWQPKEFNEQNPDPFEDDKGQGNHFNEPIVSKQIPAGRKGHLQDTSPLPSHDISEERAFFPPVSTIGPKTGNEFDSSLTAYAKGFQPTIPGNNPRVGHSHVGREEENEQNAPSSTPNAAHSLDSNPDDFRPTASGYSPGVGHSYQSINREPNA
ncbi:hypothetical protein ACH5RR_014080 [Cinchona calisaya]|uniref:Uncharacterized protein n=1 Tax=Cinchona calisaya TaxID=153742 RepID=A0ABD3A7P4_9GENT